MCLEDSTMNLEYTIQKDAEYRKLTILIIHLARWNVLKTLLKIEHTFCLRAYPLLVRVSFANFLQTKTHALSGDNEPHSIKIKTLH